MGRSRVSLRVVCCALLVAAVTYACGGGGSGTPTQPTPPPLDRTPIRVISGAGQTDTVDAVLSQALVVEIHDTAGKAFVGATARFTSVIGSTSLLVAPVNTTFFGTVGSDVADAQGRAKTLVKMGVVAGTVRLEVAVPSLGAVDTITYSVQPGAPVKFTISPRDTVIQPGTSYTLKAQPADRYSNLISSAAPTYSATGVTVSSAGLVSATNVTARARIGVSYQGVSDSAYVQVVPRFPMVINRNQSVVLINSDGTGATTLATTTNFFNSNSPSSVAATPSVAYVGASGCCGGTGVWVAQPNAIPRTLLPVMTGADGGPSLSPDGAWVYFVRSKQTLWRAHLDGTGLDSLGSFASARQFPAPTISPDGSSIAIDDGNGIQIIDVTTKASRTVPVQCRAPRYSPDGAYFACVGVSDVSIVKTDGTGQRVVADLFSADPDDVSGVDWSPDGKWLVTTTTYQGAVLVEVSSGAVISLRGLGIGAAQVKEASFVR